MTGDRDFKGRLAVAAGSLGFELTAQQADQLLSYLLQLQRWNKSYNLTALKDPDQMLVHHLFDSMAILPVMTNILDKNTVQGPLIADVGSGGGLPGLVVAILRPDWQIHCIDAVEKKTAFIQQMIGAIGLPNLRVTHARVETLEALGADIVVSRAFASLLDFATLAGPHVASGGRLLAMKGREPEDELTELFEHTDWQLDEIIPLTVPELNAQRCLVSLHRLGNP